MSRIDPRPSMSDDYSATPAWRDYCFCVGICGCRSKTAAALPVALGDLPFASPPNSSLRTSDAVDVIGFSRIGKAVYKTLRWKHFWYYKSLWNVSSGRVIAVHATPRIQSPSNDEAKPLSNDENKETTADDTSLINDKSSEDSLPYPSSLLAMEPGHTDWFPEHLGNLVAQTEEWCDVLNLGPPDGLFLTHFAYALYQLHLKGKPIVVRMMFGHVIGMPVNCKAVLQRLTANIPPDSPTKLRLWVGAWRKGVSWNHAKIIAVDGYRVLTGGHNLWDLHYLRNNPVHDLSIELEGQVAEDAHMFANDQWRFLEKMDNSCFGSCITRVQDCLPVIFKTYISLRRFPLSSPRHPPNYVQQRLFVPWRRFPKQRPNQVPIITMGRAGALTRFQRRPSDDAIVSMLEASTKSCKLALQDLGPVTIPGTKITVPGCVWPHQYLTALGRVLWKKNVNVDLILSNPLSVPGGLNLMQAVYGNGWTCVDVAAEIIKAIKKQFPTADDASLRSKVGTQLRVCYLRGPNGQRTWDDGSSMGFHAKHFIIDDMCYYLGSQNLYIADLAEWGVVVDHANATEEMLDLFWKPLWQRCYNPDDCNLQDVMDGLDIERDGEDPTAMSADTKQLLASVRRASQQATPPTARAQRPSASIVDLGQAGTICQHRREGLYLEDDDEILDDGDDDEGGRRRGVLRRFVSRRSIFRTSV